jgi:ligand-binding sensor domain-containing protein/signal transduction histidine kinase
MAKRMKINELRIILIVLALIFCQDILYSQQKSIKFKNIGIDQGLSNNNVLTVIQDKKGFIWIGTKDGLNFYDGYSFKVFKNTGKPNSLSSNHIQTLFEDSKGNIWIGTYDGGLNRFNRNDQTFTVFKNNSDDPHSITSDNIYAISEDSFGNIWVGTFGGGLCKFNPKTESFLPYKKLPGAGNTITNNSVFAIHPDKDGSLWLGTYGGGLCQFFPDKNSFQYFIHDPQDKTSISGNDIYSITEDSNGKLWIGTFGHGLSMLNKSSKKFENFKHDPTDPFSLSSNYILSIKVDPLGTVWVATKGGGINYFDEKTKKFNSYTTKKHPDIKSNDINHLFLDQLGFLWLSSDGEGVVRFNTHALAFTNFVGDGKTSNFTARSIIELFEDSKGNTWVGTFGEGLYMFNNKNETFRRFGPEFFNPLSPLGGNITAVNEDNNGKIWVGTADNGIFLLDNLNDYNVIQNFEDFNSRLTSNSIETIYKDKDGKFWIGTYGGGVCKLDPYTKEFESFFVGKDESNISGNIIKVIFEDSKRNLWFGSKDNGISFFDKKNNRLTNYKFNKADPYSIPGNSITAIEQINDSLMIIGTFDNGLAILNTRTEKFDKVLKRNDSFNNEVCGIIKGSKNFYWISTTNGLLKYDLDKDLYERYTVDDGLHHNEFVHWASFKNSEGNLYFGGLGYFVKFDPEKIVINDYVPPIYLTSFYLYNESYKTLAPVYESNRFELNHDDNFFELEFAYLNFLPEETEYSYMLEGNDKQWINRGSRRTASYTNLEPAKYTFKVRAKDKHGVWSEASMPISIIIHPAWYNTWWFKLLLIFGLIGGVMKYHQLRIIKIVKQKTYLEKVVEKRTKELVNKQKEIEETNKNLVYANNIIEDQNEELKSINEQLELRVQDRTVLLQKANEELIKSNLELDSFLYRAYHDIKGPIATIEGLCKVALMDVNDTIAIDYLSRLDFHCVKTKLALSKIINLYEIRKADIIIEKIDLRSVITKIFDSYKTNSNEAFQKKLKLNLQVKNSGVIFSDKLLVSTILNNLIENGFKYSRDKDDSYLDIIVEETHEDTFCILLKDNGIGIPTELNSQVFNMFFRASADESGTGMGLYISKIAAEKCKGSIIFDNDSSGETIFKILLPNLKNVEEEYVNLYMV